MGQVFETNARSFVEKSLCLLFRPLPFLNGYSTDEIFRENDWEENFREILIEL